MSSQRKLSSYSVFFIPWNTPENKPSRAKVFHFKKVKSKSISFHAFSSPSSEERGESEILIAYLVLLSSTHLRPLPAHFKIFSVQRCFFKSKSTSQTKQEESELLRRADESGLIQGREKMPHLRGDLTTWSMWRQHADSSSTKPRSTCKKGGPSSSRWKLWKINKDDQWSPISSFRCLLFSIFIFRLHFSIFSCVLNWFISFLCRNVWIFPPLKLIAKFTLGGRRLSFLRIREVFSPFSLFCFVLFIYFYFFCLLLFSDIGDNV